jgi:transcriptional regulator of acetoin/glycerol metabolism
VMLADNDRIDLRLLPESVVRSGEPQDGVMPAEALQAPPQTFEAQRAVNASGAIEAPAETSPLLLDEVIRRTLVRSLEETDGNRRRAADLLGISRSTLYRMLARYSLAEEETGRLHNRTAVSENSRRN